MQNRRVEYYINDKDSKFQGCNIKINKRGQYGLILTISINRDFVLNQYGVKWQEDGFHSYQLLKNRKYQKDIAELKESDSQAALKKLYLKNLFPKYDDLREKLLAFRDQNDSIDLEFLTEQSVFEEAEKRKARGSLVLKSDAERAAASIGIYIPFERRPWEAFLAAQFFRISINPKKVDSAEYLEKLLPFLTYFKIIPENQIAPLREVLGLPSKLSLDSKIAPAQGGEKVKEELESILPKEIQERMATLSKTHPNAQSEEILNQVLTNIAIKEGPEKLSNILDIKKDALTVGELLLFWAVKNGDKNLSLIHLLQGHGVNLNISDKQKRQPLHWAAKLEHIEIVSLLTKSGAPEQTDDSGRTPAHYAALSEKYQLIDQLSSGLIQADNNGKLPLHYAAESGASITVLTILNKCNNKLLIDCQDQSGDTPLHKAAARLGGPDSKDHREYVRVIKMLLDAGHSPNIKNKNGETPIDLAKQLLDPNLVKHIFTPLQISHQYSSTLFAEQFENLGDIEVNPNKDKGCSIS